MLRMASNRVQHIRLHVKSTSLYRQEPYLLEVCLSGSFRLIPEKALQDALRFHYEKMMSERDAPTFESILARLAKLEKEINER
jgi:hypothetical protein